MHPASALAAAWSAMNADAAARTVMVLYHWCVQ